MPDRSDLLLSYFTYLLKEYNFHLERKVYSPETMGNALVMFKSPNLGIEIVIDRNEVLICIGDINDQRWDWCEFTDVLKYYAPQIEKAYIFPTKTADITWDEVVNIQLSRLSNILRQYCEPILKGETLMKKDIKKIEEERVAKQFGKYMRGPTG